MNFKAPSTGTFVMGMLATLMTAHIGILAFGGYTCAELAQRYPGRETRPFCKEADAALQQAVETYLAVILALLAPITKAD